MTDGFSSSVPLRHGARAGLLAAVAALALAGSAQAGSLTPIASFADPAGTTQVLDINDSGWMAGSIGYADGSALGFIRDAGGAYTTFSVDYTTQGRAIDNSNNVSGFATDSTGNLRTDHEFIRAPGGGVTYLLKPSDSTLLRGIAQGMNGSGAIVGDYLAGPGDTNPRHGFILSGGVLTDLSAPGSVRTAARGIADDGTVAGWALFGGTVEAFIYSGGVYSFFTHPGAANTYFEDINNSGLVAGEWLDGGGAAHAFVYNSLSHIFTDINVAGAGNSQAFGLNNLGQVVITTDIAHGPNNFLFDIHGVPEPQTWALMLVGFAGAGAALRRRQRAAVVA